jgi:uncharacterized membrane protein HdeD (DUF308 family)
MAAVTVDTYGVVPEGEFSEGPPFWALLTIGILWILLSFLVLQFTYSSILSISLIVGTLLCLAGVTEVAEAFIVEGWRWAHGLIGVLFLLGGVFTFVYPGQTFGTLAIIFGWYLLIKGTLDIVTAFMLHGMPLWWMGLLVGFAEIALAFWTVGYVGRSAALLILWVGIGALLRGIVTIVAAFRVRRATKALT